MGRRKRFERDTRRAIVGNVRRYVLLLVLLVARMTTRLRHRPTAEEEDAAALKLGPGMELSLCVLRSLG
jgi:hypothetical protein